MYNKIWNRDKESIGIPSLKADMSLSCGLVVIDTQGVHPGTPRIASISVNSPLHTKPPISTTGMWNLDCTSYNVLQYIKDTQITKTKDKSQVANGDFCVAPT